MIRAVYLIVLSAMVFLAVGCKEKPWEAVSKIEIEEADGSTGLLKEGSNFWITDSEANKVFYIDQNGKVLKTFDNFERPMHMTVYNGHPMIPEYGIDSIAILDNGNKTHYPFNVDLDAPAGVDYDPKSKSLAIADFYNHRVVLIHENGDTLAIGRKGDEDGEFHYPTDVQFFNNQLWVADAYNHRIQVFDMNGTVLDIIGQDDGMDAATGLFVDESHVYVTDFENSRVLMYDHSGKLKRIATDFSKPIDVLAEDGILYVLNFESNSIDVLKI